VSGPISTMSQSILVVEDSSAQCELLSQALAQHRCEEAIHIEHGIAPALTYLNQQLEDHAPLPRLILVDLKLKTGSGLDIVRYIRNHERLQRVPVVVLTTSDAQHDIEASYAAGANAYVVKPGAYADFIKLMGDFCRFWLGWNRTA
jgi:CheY-like chemotaxis protein